MSDVDIDPLALYRHRSRSQWGFGILTSEEGGRRRYQFEDGKLRTFKEGFYGLLERVEVPAEERRRVLAELEKKLGLSLARLELAQDARASGGDVYSFDDQLLAFERLFPGGFDDPKWLSDVRGRDQKSPRKRHREAVAAKAQELLGMERLDTAIAEGRFTDVYDDIIAVLEATDLVSPSKEVATVRRLPAARHEELARRTRDLVHGEGGHAAHLDNWVAILVGPDGVHASWRLATVLAALVHPDLHVCVRPTPFRQQAKWFLPSLRWSARPTGRTYDELLTVARRVMTALYQKELQPHDLLDAHDFIVQTMRPAARALVKERRTTTPAPAAEEDSSA